MNKLAIFGGCSNVGKSEVISQLGRRYHLDYATKFDLVANIAYGRNMPPEEMFRQFSSLELEAMRLLAQRDYSLHFLLDAHFAIQPSVDNDIALKKMPTDFSEPYCLSFSKESIEALSKVPGITVFCLYATPEQILERRRRNLERRVQRSLDLDDIKAEIGAEYEMFLEFVRIARAFTSLESAILENGDGKLETTISLAKAKIGLK